MTRISSVIIVALLSTLHPSAAQAQLRDCVYSAKIGGNAATLTKRGNVYGYTWDDPGRDQDYVARNVTFDGREFKIDRASLRIDRWINSNSFEGRFKLNRFSERVVFTCN